MRNHQWVYSSSESEPIAKVQLVLIFVAYLTAVLLLSILESESDSIVKVKLPLIFVAYLTEVLLLQGTRERAQKVIKTPALSQSKSAASTSICCMSNQIVVTTGQR